MPSSAESYTFRLRAWQDADLAPYAAMNADAEVMEHFPRPMTAEESRQSFERLRTQIDQRGWGLWVVECDGEFAGFTGLAEPRFSAAFTPCVEIGWRFHRKFWGRGLAFAAARVAEEFAWRRLGLADLVSFTAVQNVRSRRLMERLGFTRNPAEDFDHPALAADCHVRRHVLYRKRAEPFAESKTAPVPLAAPDYLLRLAQPADIPALADLIARSARGLREGFYTEKQVEGAIGPIFGVDRQLIRDGTYFVIVAGGRLVGCGGWSKRRSLYGSDGARQGEDPLRDPTIEPAMIRAFFVDPDHARRGLGRTLLSASETAALAAGFTQIAIVATLPGVPLYRARGYREGERLRIPLSNGETLPVVRMHK